VKNIASQQANTKMEYKKLLIIQQVLDGVNYTDIGSVVDTYESFHVVCQEFPFKHLPEIKDLAKREWFDENGDDVYVPTDGLKFKAYDLEVKFLYVGLEEEMADDLKAFIAFSYGRNDGGSPMLAIYDEYTKTGRRGVYVQNTDNDLFMYNDANSEALASFKVKFRVTDPVTDITLSL